MTQDQQARMVITALEDAQSDALFEQLALRQQAVEQGLVDPQTYAVQLPQGSQAFDLSAAQAFGRSFFAQVAIQTQASLCASNNENRSALARALPNATDSATVLSGILVSLGIAVPFVAPVVALVCIRVIAAPTIAAFCEGLTAAVERERARTAAGG